MKKILILNLLLILFVFNSYSQYSFLGFEQEQCGLVQNHGYTYSNLGGLCSSHSAIYKIFLNGISVYEKPCQYLQFYSVDTLFFINDSTGFLIEYSGNNLVYKTEDFGKTWKQIGSGAPVFWGFYVINEHNVYLITGANGTGPIINRASDIDRKTTLEYSGVSITGNKAIINDTIFGNSTCGHDSLSFKIKNGADTITYKFALTFSKLPTTINEISAVHVEVYPNPCRDYIYVSQNRWNNREVVCRIYSMDGRLIKTDELVDNCLFVGDLKTGFYLMEMQKGDTKLTRKIIKQ